MEKLQGSCIEELITTDTVPTSLDFGGKVKILSVAAELAEAIRRIHDGGSLSSLFY